MAFEELKQRQAMAWGSAPFENLVDGIADVHEELVRELDPQPGETWLDVGTGTGAVAMRAARAGAEVTGSDLSSPLIETAKRLAREEGLEIAFEVGDAEELPYGNADFDVVSSSFGVIFAPDHEAAAHELARVTKPGGRIGLAAWDPNGRMVDMFRLLASYQPPPPEGAGSPLDWGREDHARELLEKTFELRFVYGTTHWDDSPDESWELMVNNFGPVKTLYSMLDEERREGLRSDYIGYVRQFEHDGVVDEPGEYVIILGRRK
jgi:SAM-dependent methyltransferase